ncbi:MAG: RNA polymerase sigma factor [Patescibacteria group bacterium]
MNWNNPKNDFLDSYEKYSDAIFRHCYFRMNNRERAKELMQDAFMKTWEYISKGNIIENIRAFLYRTANNLIIDDARKKKEASLEELNEKGFQPSYDKQDEIKVHIEYTKIMSVINKLPSNHRDLIIMRYVDELSPKEIAHVVQESENAVSVRLNRSIKKLRDLIKYNNSPHNEIE